MKVEKLITTTPQAFRRILKIRQNMRNGCAVGGQVLTQNGGEHIKMTRYKIKVKRDFGNKPFLINGQYVYVKTGFVVTDGFCNVMPGAIWFLDIPTAMKGIRILEKAKATGIDFWTLWRYEKGDFRDV